MRYMHTSKTSIGRTLGFGFTIILVLGCETVFAQPAEKPAAETAAAQNAPPSEPPEKKSPKNVLEAEANGFDLFEVLKEGGKPMTADQAAQLAVEHSPSAASAQAALDKSREGADRAFLAVYPRLDLSARYTRLSKVELGSIAQGANADEIAALQSLIDEHEQVSSAGADFDRAVLGFFQQFGDLSFPQYLNQYALRAQVTYPLSDLFFTILPAYRAAEGYTEAQALSVRAEKQKVALQAREAFYNYASARASLAVAESALEQVEAHRRDVVAMVEAGSLASVELKRMDARVAKARVAVARGKGGLAIARTGLSVLIGKRIDQDIAIVEDLYTPLPPLTASPEELLKQAKQNRPEILALNRIIEAHQESIDASSGSRYPHLALSAGVDYANPNQRVFPQEEKFKPSWDISAVLTWSPNDLFEGGHKAAEAEYDLAKARTDIDGLEDALEVEVTQAWQQYDAARAAMQAAESGIQAAEESYRVWRELFQAGAAVATEVIDAESELSNARLDLINSAIDMRIARARLDRAIGRL